MSWVKEMTIAEKQATTAEKGVHANRPIYDDVDNISILMVGICSAIITVIVVAVAQGLAYRWETSMFNERLKSKTHLAIENAIQAQRNNLESPKGEGRISIEEAMRQVIEEYGKPPASRGGGKHGEHADG